MSSFNLVLVRHGQSQWNKQNLFTGWRDIDLSEKGIEEAKQAGLSLKQKGLSFDVAFSSILKRTIHTLQHILQELNLADIPITNAWQLNEKHYGQLQGQNKKDMVSKYGEQTVQKWRRSYDTPPPLLPESESSTPPQNYIGLSSLPRGESLKDTQKRVIPFWTDCIFTHIQKNQCVLVVAHGNSLRALIKHLETIPDHEIHSLEIKTGQPMMYHIDPQTEEVLKKEWV